MFDTLSARISHAFSSLTSRGRLSEADVDAALREVRVALLEADVALPVVKSFIAELKEQAIGEQVIRSVSPGQMVIKLVHDHLVALLGGEAEELNLAAQPPVVLLMVGLQGSGKTTSTAKLARWLTGKHGKTPLMASLDVQRPAAQEQLAVLGEQAGVATLPIIAGQTPEAITQRALTVSRRQGHDVLLLDTAGRLHIDMGLMQELQAVRTLAEPTETLLVADSLMGQDAVRTAEAFHEQIGLSGIILTRIDGDARGGAALSMRQVTGCPVKFVGIGEKLDAFEPFHPERIASRILDMGDVVSLVEKASEAIEAKEAEAMAKKMKKGKFDLDDLAAQLRTMQKMGGMGGLLKMLPGMGAMKGQLPAGAVDDGMIARQLAILSSMTRKERTNPGLLNGSRRRRIADGSGVSVQDVNRLLKQFKQMQGMMKKMKKMGGPEALLRGNGGLENLLGGGMR